MGDVSIIKNGTCAEYLHRLQRSMGITDEELERDAEEAFQPRRVNLPVLRERTPKKEQKAQKKLEKSKHKKNKKFLAYWYLEEYLKPKYAREVYEKYTDYHELVEYAYQMALNLVCLATFRLKTDMDPSEVHPEDFMVPTDETDIPDDQWDAFGEYCEKHPIKDASEIYPRRRKFKKWYRKKRFVSRYDMKKMAIYDPLFAATAPDAKRMVKELKRISAENEVRNQEFRKLIESLIPNVGKGSLLLQQFDEQTARISKRIRQRTKQFEEALGHKPNPVTIDFFDQPRMVINYDIC